MSTITVRKENGNKSAPLSAWEPFRAMRDLMNWDPFREMSALASHPAAAFVPSVEIKETKDAYVFRADVPGVKESDLDITLTGNRLTIAGKREGEKQEQTDTFYAYECSYGEFTRSFTLPDGVDPNAVHADLKEGILTLSVGKLPQAQAKKIAVQSSAKKS